LIRCAMLPARVASTLAVMLRSKMYVPAASTTPQTPPQARPGQDRRVR
jgi:hypothetical protein